jgi:hypothetical protein
MTLCGPEGSLSSTAWNGRQAAGRIRIARLGTPGACIERAVESSRGSKFQNDFQKFGSSAFSMLALTWCFRVELPRIYARAGTFLWGFGTSTQKQAFSQTLPQKHKWGPQNPDRPDFRNENSDPFLKIRIHFRSFLKVQIHC